MWNESNFHLHYRWQNLKVLTMISYFKFHFFPHLLIFLQFRDPSYVLNLSTKAVLQKWHYSVQENQIFAVWINFSPGINKFRRVFLDINHVNLAFKLQWWTSPFLMALSCAYIIFFQFSEIIFLFFQTNHT